MIRYALFSLAFLLTCCARHARVVTTTATSIDSTVTRSESGRIDYSRFTTLETDFEPMTYAVQVPVVIRDTIREYRTEYRTKLVPRRTRQTSAETGTQQQAKTETKAVAAQQITIQQQIVPTPKTPWYTKVRQWLGRFVLDAIILLFIYFLYRLIQSKK